MIRYDIVTNLGDYQQLVRELFDQVRFGRYLADYKLDIAKSIDLEYGRLQEYLKDGTLLLAIKDDRELVGLIGYHFSQWDTELFGHPYAIIDYFLVKEPVLYQYLDTARELLRRFHAWAAERRVRTVVVKPYSNNCTPILAVQQEGYQYFECATFLTLDKVPPPPMGRDELAFRYAEERDRDQLRELVSKQFFRRSHFFLDPRFPEAAVEKLYGKWIESSLTKGQPIVITEEAGRICGVFIYDMADLTVPFGRKYAVWKLANIDGRVRGKGLGMRLYYATVQSSLDRGADAIDSSLAVHNVVSMNMIIKMGFRLITSVYTFHRWFD